MDRPNPQDVALAARPSTVERETGNNPLADVADGVAFLRRLLG